MAKVSASDMLLPRKGPFPYEYIFLQVREWKRVRLTCGCEADDGVGAGNIPVSFSYGRQFGQEIFLWVIEILPMVDVALHAFMHRCLDRPEVNAVVLRVRNFSAVQSPPPQHLTRNLPVFFAILHTLPPVCVARLPRGSLPRRCRSQ